MQALGNLATINGAPLLNTSLWRKTDRGLCSTFAGSSTFTGLFCKKAFLGNNCIEKTGDLFVRATWRFFGGGGGKSTNASIEHSEAALEDVLLFYFQLDLETRVQYCLNTEQYDIAKMFRDKLNEVEAGIIKQQQAKRGSSKSEAQDKELKILTLRADIKKAIESENYDVAAKLRDEVSKLETEALTASAKALAFENVEYAFRLGQQVQHKVFGYRAVICGMDSVCCESKLWMEKANIDKLSRGPNQPFYQVLVDVYADPNLLVAYVAEENLLAREEQDKGRFDHPYTPFLFYGTDTAGDFIPIRQLREKFDRPRYEPPYEQGDDGTGDA
ncbi:DNA binding protein [Carex littledalei]|uniref:DNA binding protein n=1 Tax=Carex littledalei TaxID=544730 RepID=A0A833R015_9POAL|nr:DNA binding protein [Carex littledalei]